MYNGKPLNHITVKLYFLKYLLELTITLNQIDRLCCWMVIIKLMMNYPKLFTEQYLKR